VPDPLVITNPKRTRSQNGRSAWYPYYAGFCYDFAKNLITSAKLGAEAIVMDGWNGSGTTTSVASALGHSSRGFDLNPVMVVVAKARLVSKREHSSLDPLAADITEKALVDKAEPLVDDPLQLWMGRRSANDIRKLERAIQQLLLDHEHYETPATRPDFDKLSGIGAFLYLALFRTVRTLLEGFVASNPTWVKTPRSPRARLRPNTETIFGVFRAQILSMVDTGNGDLFEHQDMGRSEVCTASSESLPIEDESVSFALASPPYCTRIDYAVATKPELAVLGYTAESFRSLRESLLGTSTVPPVLPAENENWGPSCLKFLHQVRQHKSHASNTYYYKNHLQYFQGLYKSVGELRRVLGKDGRCVLIVQDSYYKDVKNDLPRIVIEMAYEHALRLTQYEHFTHTRTMAAVNPWAHSYRTTFTATESVLVFKHAA